jgi:hypothetical protein
MVRVSVIYRESVIVNVRPWTRVRVKLVVDIPFGDLNRQ